MRKVSNIVKNNDQNAHHILILAKISGRSDDCHLPLPRQIFITTFGKILRATLYTETIQEKFIYSSHPALTVTVLCR